MLVPLTDNTDPYATMMLAIIADRQERARAAHRPAAPTPTRRPRIGVRVGRPLEEGALPPPEAPTEERDAGRGGERRGRRVVVHPVADGLLVRPDRQERAVGREQRAVGAVRVAVEDVEVHAAVMLPEGVGGPGRIRSRRRLRAPW